MEMEQKNQGTLGSIEDQFNLIAEEYDMNRRKFIPCFEDYYKNTTKFIVSNIHKPKRILDLGAGTGLLSYFWYLYFPASEYVLVDIADDMLQVARKRFAGPYCIRRQIIPESFRHKILMSLFRRCPYTIWKTGIRKSCLREFTTNCRRAGCL